MVGLPGKTPAASIGMSAVFQNVIRPIVGPNHRSTAFCATLICLICLQEGAGRATGNLVERHSSGMQSHA
jgi:hypothetical protein